MSTRQAGTSRGRWLTNACWRAGLDWRAAGVIGGGVVLVILGLGLVQRPTNLTWTRRKALASLVAFAALGVGLIAAGVASLVGLLGSTKPGGFRTNDFAALAICFGAVALVFAYASYRSMNRAQ